MRHVSLYTIARAVIVVAGAVALSGCVTAGPAAGSSGASGRGGALPAWYTDPQSVYPEQVYLTAVGTGDSRRDAEQQALAGLSQIFEAQVSVDMRTSERYRDIMTAQGTVSESELSLAQSTNVRSNQTLLNVQFGESAVDELGRVHVIAFIERVPTGRVYSDLIARNGGQVVSFLARADTASGLIEEYAYVSAAAVVASANESLRDQLAIIAPQAAGALVLPYRYEAVLERRVGVATQLSTAVAISGDDNDRIGSVVREAISQERLPIATADAVLQVVGRVSVTPEALSGSFETVRWVLSLEMRGPDGRVLVSYDGQDRSSAVTVDSAIAFAYRDMEEIVAGEFVGAMRSYFDGLVLGR